MNPTSRETVRIQNAINALARKYFSDTATQAQKDNLTQFVTNMTTNDNMSVFKIKAALEPFKTDPALYFGASNTLSEEFKQKGKDFNKLNVFLDNLLGTVLLNHLDTVAAKLKVFSPHTQGTDINTYFSLKQLAMKGRSAQDMTSNSAEVNTFISNLNNTHPRPLVHLPPSARGDMNAYKYIAFLKPEDRPLTVFEYFSNPKNQDEVNYNKNIGIIKQHLMALSKLEGDDYKLLEGRDYVFASTKELLDFKAIAKSNGTTIKEYKSFDNIITDDAVRQKVREVFTHNINANSNVLSYLASKHIVSPIVAGNTVVRQNELVVLNLNVRDSPSGWNPREYRHTTNLEAYNGIVDSIIKVRNDLHKTGTLELAIVGSQIPDSEKNDLIRRYTEKGIQVHFLNDMVQIGLDRTQQREVLYALADKYVNTIYVGHQSGVNEDAPILPRTNVYSLSEYLGTGQIGISRVEARTQLDIIAGGQGGLATGKVSSYGHFYSLRNNEFLTTEGILAAVQIKLDQYGNEHQSLEQLWSYLSSEFPTLTASKAAPSEAEVSALYNKILEISGEKFLNSQSSKVVNDAILVTQQPYSTIEAPELNKIKDGLQAIAAKYIKNKSKEVGELIKSIDSGNPLSSNEIYSANEVLKYIQRENSVLEVTRELYMKALYEVVRRKQLGDTAFTPSTKDFVSQIMTQEVRPHDSAKPIERLIAKLTKQNLGLEPYPVANAQIEHRGGVVDEDYYFEMLYKNPDSTHPAIAIKDLVSPDLWGASDNSHPQIINLMNGQLVYVSEQDGNKKTVRLSWEQMKNIIHSEGYPILKAMSEGYTGTMALSEVVLSPTDIQNLRALPDQTASLAQQTLTPQGPEPGFDILKLTDAYRRGEVTLSMLNPAQRFVLGELFTGQNGDIDVTKLENTVNDSAAYLQFKDGIARQALINASREGKTQIVNTILRDDDAINSAAVIDAFEAAYYEKHLGIVFALTDPSLPAHLLPDLRGNHAAIIALVKAVKENNRALAERMLDRGVSPDPAGNHDISPLTHAIEQDSLLVASLLIQRNADLTRSTAESNKMSPITAAIAKNNQNLLEEMITHTTNPADLTRLLNTPDGQGYTSLGIAAIKDNVTMIKRLIIAGANVNYIDHHGYSILDYYQSTPDSDPGRLALLDAGAKTSSDLLTAIVPGNYLPNVPQGNIQQLLGYQELLDTGAVKLSDAIDPYRGKGASLRFAPQSFLLGEKAQGICDALSEAWLFTQAQNDNGAMSKRLLDNIFLHSDFIQPGEHNPFLETLNKIHSQGPRKIQSLDQVVERLVSASGDVLLSLHTGNHALSLSRRTVNGETRYALYDPNLGEVTLPAGTGGNQSDLKSMMNSILDMKVGNHHNTLADYYQTVSRNGEYTFTVQEMDKATAANPGKGFRELQSQLTGVSALQDVQVAALSRLKSVEGSFAAQSAAVQIMDTAQEAQQAFAEDMQTLSSRINERVTASGYKVDDITGTLRWDEQNGPLKVSVHDTHGATRYVEVDIYDLDFHSKTLVNNAVEELASHETSAKPGIAHANELFGRGLGALMTVRTLSSLFESIQHGDTHGIVDSSGWTLSGIASLTGADQKVIDKIGSKLGSFIMRDSKLAIKDMSSFISRGTEALLARAGVQSERVIAAVGEGLGRLPLLALGFGIYSVVEDIKKLNEDDNNGLPGWQTDLDEADIGLDTASTILQTVAPFTGPAAPFLEAAGMLIMGIRMTIDDIVADFNTGHADRARGIITLSALVPISMFIRPFVKIFTGSAVIDGVNNVDNLFNVSTKNGSDGESHWLDLTKGSLKNDEQLTNDGNPANYAGNLTMDFSGVGESGGDISISSRHENSNGALAGSDGGKHTDTRHVSSNIDNIMLGRGSATDQKGNLVSASTAMERIIANKADNLFVAPAGSATVTDREGNDHLYRYAIDARGGNDTLRLAEGQYEFEGGDGSDTLDGSLINANQDGQALVWDLTAQIPIPKVPHANEPHTLVTALSQEQTKAAIAGNLAEMDSRTQLAKTQIEAHGVENVLGGYRATVTVTGGEGSSFNTDGAAQEVFKGDEHKNLFQTGGGDDVIYRSAGDDTFIINRSYALHSSQGAEHEGYSTDESKKWALLTDMTSKQWTYTEVTLVSPSQSFPGNDTVILEGAHYKDIQIKEISKGASKGAVLVGYGDQQSAGLYVKVANRSALAGLNFMTDDGVSFHVNIPKNSDQDHTLHLNLDIVEASSFDNDNSRNMVLRIDATEDGFSVLVKRGDSFLLPSSWQDKARLMLDVKFSELRFYNDGTGDFVIDSGADPREEAADLSQDKRNLLVHLNQLEAKTIRLQTRDGYAFDLVKQGQHWVTKNTQLMEGLSATGATLTSPLLKALLTQGEGAIGESELAKEEWHAREPNLKGDPSGIANSGAGASGLLISSGTPGGWLKGLSGDDTLMAHGGTTLLDGGNGHDTYIVKRGDGEVIVADSGVHEAGSNWADGTPDGKANIVLFQGIQLDNIQSELSSMYADGHSNGTLVLKSPSDNVAVKILTRDLAGYQFISGDGVSFVYRQNAQGNFEQHVVGLNREFWNKFHPEDKGHETATVTSVINRLEGHYEGSSDKENVTLTQPGSTITPGKGSDKLHLKSGAGNIVELHAGDGTNTLYLDVAEHSIEKHATSTQVGELVLTGMKKEVWDNVVPDSSTGSGDLTTLASKRPADHTSNDAPLTGSTSPHQLVRLTSKIWLAANTTYLFDYHSASHRTMSFTVTGSAQTGFIGQHPEFSNNSGGKTGEYVSTHQAGFYGISLLYLNTGGDESYDIRGRRASAAKSAGKILTGIPVSAEGNPTDKTPSVPENKDKQGAPVTVSFRDYAQHELWLRVDNGKTVTVGGGTGETAVSAVLSAKDIDAYRILTKDGLISSLDSNGHLTLNEVDFSRRTMEGPLDMRGLKIHPTSAGQWLAVKGSSSDNTFIGANNQAIVFVGGTGDELVQGGTKADTFNGGIGNDVLQGLGGDDALMGGSGADFLDGGQGNDTAFYQGSVSRAKDGSLQKSGVTVDLAQGKGQGGDAEGDILKGIENITGSAYDDTLRGDTGNNIIRGGAGKDVLSGGGGVDILQGGTGNNTYLVRQGDTVLIDRTETIPATTQKNNASETIVLEVGDHDHLQWEKKDRSLIVTTDQTVLELNNIFGPRGSFNGPYQFVLINHNQQTSWHFSSIDFYLWLMDGADFEHDALPHNGGKLPYETYQALLAPGVIHNKQDNTGTAGNDQLVGDDSANHLFGREGNDTLEGGAGSDVLDGGRGIDTASYEHSAHGVSVHLNQSVMPANACDAQGDVLLDIENLRGSNESDTLVGDDGNNVIEGGGGADVLDGGAGFDLVSYEHSGSYWVPSDRDDHVHVNSSQRGKNIGVYVDLAAKEASRGDAGINAQDTITGFEGVVGSHWADILKGDDNDNLFVLNGYSTDHNDQKDAVDGRGGNDTVSFASSFYSGGVEVHLGREGRSNYTSQLNNIESAIGSDGDDQLHGDDQDNELYGGKGNDILSGHGGNDYLAGGAGMDTYQINSGDHVIISQDGNGNSIDHISFNDINNLKSEMNFSRHENNLLITSKDGSTSVQLNNWRSGDSHYLLVANKGYSPNFLHANEIQGMLPPDVPTQTITINNGGFEQSSPGHVAEGWTVTQGGTVSLNIAAPSEGGKSVDLTGRVTLSQTLSEVVEAGESYRLTIDVRSKYAPLLSLKIFAGNTQLESMNTISIPGWEYNMDWKHVTLNVSSETAKEHTGKALRVEIIGNALSGTIGLDNIHLEKVTQEIVSAMGTFGNTAGESSDA